MPLAGLGDVPRLLRHAVLEAYREVLPRGRFPTALLFLEVPPEEVDVNEILFRPTVQEL